VVGWLSRRIVVVALLVPALPVSAQKPETTAPSRFRSSVDVVSVSAVVRDRKGRFVRDLEQKDFVIAEAGVPRPILDFRAQSDGPVRLALLFDVSGSMRMGSKASDARETARQLLSALRPSDQAAVYMFDTRLNEVAPFTSDLTSLEAALARVDTPYGQTSLYDAVAETARSLGGNGMSGGQLQRTAVVVLTDGVDTRSRMTPSQVTTVASGIDVPVYVVAVMAPIDDPRQSDGQVRPGPATGLRSLSQWTGGEMFTASAPAHASVAARQIVDELRHQYLLAIEASATQRGWRPLEVRARDRDLKVRARAGYTAGAQALVSEVVEGNTSGVQQRDVR
jgi:Ca-activated chloride channel family protein